MKTLKTIALLVFIAVTTSSAFAQAEIAYNSVVTENVKSTESSKMLAPAFKGGNEALAEFMGVNLKYPELAKRQGVEGTVILAYTITKNGEIKDIKVVQSVNKELDNEAVRLAKTMPQWTPAMQDGKARDIKYQLPVKFELTF
jgi:protein TonB